MSISVGCRPFFGIFAALAAFLAWTTATADTTRTPVASARATATAFSTAREPDAKATTAAAPLNTTTFACSDSPIDKLNTKPMSTLLILK